jgi:hypothetical protein
MKHKGKLVVAFSKDFKDLRDAEEFALKNRPVGVRVFVHRCNVNGNIRFRVVRNYVQIKDDELKNCKKFEQDDFDEDGHRLPFLPFVFGAYPTYLTEV